MSEKTTASAIYLAIGDLDPDLLEAADRPLRQQKKRWWWLLLPAACICLALLLTPRTHPTRPIVKWQADMDPSAYFLYADTGSNETGSATSLAFSQDPGWQRRSFADARADLESEEVIPVLDTHPLFELQVYYTAEGEFQYLDMSWHRRDLEGLTHYSDLRVQWAVEEQTEVSDTVVFELDEEGNILPESITVTERDGIQITGTGRENQQKSLTCTLPTGWLSVTGSWNDDYASVASLFDWFFTHPIDSSRFPLESGNIYSYLVDTEALEALAPLAPYMPNFETFGYNCVSCYLTCKNDQPVAFEGHYALSPSTQESIHYCVFLEPDYYDRTRSIASLDSLTLDTLQAQLTDAGNIYLDQGDALLAIYSRDAATCWELLQSLLGA